MRIHSILSPKCFIQTSTIEGKGVYSNNFLEEGEIVAIWGGKIYTANEIESLSRSLPHFLTHTVSVCPGYYLGSENLFEFDDCEYFNHSCEANVGVKGQIVLVTRKKIYPGEELTFDYDTTEMFSEPFQCKCGMKLCRGIIDGTGWSDEGFLDRNKEYLSWYMQDRLGINLKKKLREQKFK